MLGKEFPSRAAYREFLLNGIDECTAQLQQQNQLVESLRHLVPGAAPPDLSAIVLTRDCYRKIVKLLEKKSNSSSEWREISKLHRQSAIHFTRGAKEWGTYVRKHKLDLLIPGLEPPRT